MNVRTASYAVLFSALTAFAVSGCASPATNEGSPEGEALTAAGNVTLDFTGLTPDQAPKLLNSANTPITSLSGAKTIQIQYPNNFDRLGANPACRDGGPQWYPTSA